MVSYTLFLLIKFEKFSLLFFVFVHCIFMLSLGVAKPQDFYAFKPTKCSFIKLALQKS